MRSDSSTDGARADAVSALQRLAGGATETRGRWKCTETLLPTGGDTEPSSASDPRLLPARSTLRGAPSFTNSLLRSASLNDRARTVSALKRVVYGVIATRGPRCQWRRQYTRAVKAPMSTSAPRVAPMTVPACAETGADRATSALGAGVVGGEDEVADAHDAVCMQVEKVEDGGARVSEVDEVEDSAEVVVLDAEVVVLLRSAVVIEDIVVSLLCTADGVMALAFALKIVDMMVAVIDAVAWAPDGTARTKDARASWELFAGMPFGSGRLRSTTVCMPAVGNVKLYRRT